jgi:glutamate synthase domain-containing protein 2
MRKSQAAVPAIAAAGLAAYDLLQRKHAILRTFPVVGHARYALEEIGPELRQYIVTNNNDERPFSRDQRTWVYASSKAENNYFGFGTDNDIEDNAGYAIIKHRAFADIVPTGVGSGGLHDAVLPSAKVLGAPRGRRLAFRPDSVVNVSAMSYGSLSGQAIEALNRGAARAGTLHNTGEGGLSDHHRQGGDLVLQIGTGYFGCRDAAGRFSLDALLATLGDAPVRALEIKLSQGAKPGLGGFLPAAKVTPQIARIRGIPEGRDCVSPARHTAFTDVDSMLDFVEMLAQATGLPVGIKSAVGDEAFWYDLAAAMGERGRGVDFITIDGGEGGTGAAPLVFSDSVAFPLRAGFAKAYGAFAQAGLAQDVTWIASGKCGLPDNALVMFALGADMVNVAREAMMAIGCIQSQRCHTGRCPTGVATQNPWLARGVDPDSKSERLANYVGILRRDLLRLAEAVGVPHPGLVTSGDIEIMDRTNGGLSLTATFGYEPGWGVPGPTDRAAITEIMGSQRVA